MYAVRSFNTPGLKCLLPCTTLCICGSQFQHTWAEMLASLHHFMYAVRSFNTPGLKCLLFERLNIFTIQSALTCPTMIHGMIPVNGSCPLSTLITGGCVNGSLAGVCADHLRVGERLTGGCVRCSGVG